MAGVKGRSGSGGARVGAGRKPKAELYAKQIAGIEDSIAGKLVDLLDGLFMLSEGGWEAETRHYEIAASILREEAEDILNQEGEPTGKMRRRRVPAFPDRDPDELILVRKTSATAAPDRAAIMYLLDRMLGRPASEDETGRILGEIAKFKDTVLAALGEEDADLRKRVVTKLRRR